MSMLGRVISLPLRRRSKSCSILLASGPVEKKYTEITLLIKCKTSKIYVNLILYILGTSEMEKDLHTFPIVNVFCLSIVIGKKPFRNTENFSNFINEVLPVKGLQIK